MNIRQVTDGKEAYIELLREGDADESRPEGSGRG